MNKNKRVVIMLITLIVLTHASVVRASIIINEIFADPPTGLSGDANNDGIRSGTQDEFIELLNFSLGDIDISNWLLADSVSTRHIFSSNTILASNAFLVVFGGGSPILPGINWQVASSGSLGLNNSVDTVTLFNSDNQMIDQVVYGSIGGKDQSITRYPDGEGAEFFLHSAIEGSNGSLFSPGFGLNPEIIEDIPKDENPAGNPVVPELPTLIYFGMGWGSLLLRGKIMSI